MKNVAPDATHATNLGLAVAADDGPGAQRNQKDAAREALRNAMAKPSFGARLHLVRNVLAER